MKQIFCILFILFCGQLEAQTKIKADDYFGSFFPKDQRKAYENRSGSCVYMSTAVAGLYQNTPIAWTLPWTSEYGAECRGGAYPSSFEANAKKRGLRALSVTGEQTYNYMKWAIKNNRFVAIGCDWAHFQTLVGYDENKDIWYVWNCNHALLETDYVIGYTFEQFKQLHERSGNWCIILLDYPDRPAYPIQKVK